MKYTILGLLFSSLALFAQDAKPTTTAPTTAQAVTLSDADALAIRTKQLTQEQAREAYDKVLALPEVSKYRDAVNRTTQDLNTAATTISEKVCGKGARLAEQKNSEGDAKLVCYPAPAAPSTPAATKPAAK